MEKREVKYYVDPKGDFVIENYNLAGPFANFLPGIAGLFGIPMWAFYVNRGQCMCSIGVKSKDSPIMEFMPANRAFQLTSSQGFRTFLKIKHKNKIILYEPFKPHPENGVLPAKQKMFVNSYELRIQETVPDIGLEIEVSYFTIPNEPFAAMARVVSFRNISKKTLNVEMLDGTPLIIPYGVSNFFLKKMRRTVEAWMRVENVKKSAPFYKLNVDPSDISETAFINEGNFYMASLVDGKKNNARLPVFVDPELIFGQVNDFSYPVNFMNDKGFKVPQGQIGQNKLPCAMAHAKLNIRKGKKTVIFSLLGHISSMDKLNSLIPRLTKEQFFIDKREKNREIIHDLQKDIFTASGDNRYDLYCAQTFLDNLLRGGYPITSGGDKPSSFYVYARKHGDLERDYNRFYIAPTYFSQGNGNFRDMNQNRRNDVLFNPEIRDSNIAHFYNLIQADGFNPLVLGGVNFRLKDHDALKDGLRGKIDDKYFKELEGLLCRDFSPGELFVKIEALGIKLKKPWYEFLREVLKHCETVYKAEHGEGYWIDHWTYNLDLVESYLAVYPEKLKELLLDKKEFTFYDNLYCVKPRSEKYVLNENNKVRQYHSLTRDNEKKHLMEKREKDAHVMRTENGKGRIYKTTLIAKMLCLTANKLSSLGPCGVGIEMEADKPGWCDSMNGLPGLLGSSVPEVFELKNQVVFILDSLKELRPGGSYRIKIAEEIHDFLKKLETIIKSEPKVKLKDRDFYYWDKASSIKEQYREKTKLGFSGAEKILTAGELEELLRVFLSKINQAVDKAYIAPKKTYATYVINEVTEFESTNRRDTVKGLPIVKPTAFRAVRVPLFLEGVVRAMKAEKDLKKVKGLYEALKKTGIYDKKLKMYKINESLEGISKEVGRSSVFTPGWLENESIWLHMEYKYLLELLRAGLHRQFFEEFRNLLIPFQKPEVYGRSIFENSSFIVSSAFPDKKLHGRGFVARLSGSTAEMLSIWLLMNVGEKPFFLNEEGKLNLRFRPSLPSWLFMKKERNGFPKNSFAFTFLGKTQVVYHNPRMKDTTGPNSVKPRFMVLRYDDGKKVEIKKDIINSPCAKDIRDRKVERIDIYLG